MLQKYVSRIRVISDLAKGKDVLHLGCSSGNYLQHRINRGDLLHLILSDLSNNLFGIDIDKPSIDAMRALAIPNLYLGDVERLANVQIDIKFDLVVAGDILEHITRPGDLLEGVKRFLKPGGVLFISTNNAFGLHYQIKRWLGKYKEHPEHVCFFSPETLMNAFDRHGYNVTHLYGAYTVPPYTIYGKILFTFGYPLFKLFPVLAGTLLVIATPR